MPHQVHLRTLGRVSDHRLSMLRNLAVAVLRYERVKTTEARGKEVRRLIDKVINLGRDGSLNARRRALALTRDRLIVEKTFTDLRDRFGDRGSGFTRLVRLGHRVGDGAPMMLVELLEGAPAQAKPEAEAPAAPTGGVRGIARRLRRGGGEKRADEKADSTSGDAAAKAVKPKAAKKPATAKKVEAKKPQAKKKDTGAKRTADAGEKRASAERAPQERGPRGTKDSGTKSKKKG